MYFPPSASPVKVRAPLVTVAVATATPAGGPPLTEFWNGHALTLVPSAKPWRFRTAVATAYTQRHSSVVRNTRSAAAGTGLSFVMLIAYAPSAGIAKSPDSR